MRLVKFAGDRTGLVVATDGDLHVVDVHASRDALARVDPDAAAVLESVLPDATSSWQELIEQWSRAGAALEQLEKRASADATADGWHTTPLEAAELEPPLPLGTAGKVLGIGANFVDHLARVQTVLRGEDVSEEQARTMFPAPWGFVLVPDSIVGHDAVVIPPEGSLFLDYEAEVAVVLAVGGRYIKPEDVRFWGFAAANDFSLRDPHLKQGKPFDVGPLTWTLQKNFETATAIGPWVEVPAEPGGLPNVHIECRVEDELRQDDWTANLTWSVPDVVAHLSQFLRFRPGDVILSGTPKGTAMEDGAEGPFL
jgi:2-keto-4-pentenoate hydratase/2-oxohepta-3-ene-1,7-dioic acid hydratase in catechol pathway